MSRLLPFLVGLALLVGTGIVHGLWTDRWHPSRELTDAAERLRQLPDDVGDWKGEPYEQDAADLKASGAAGHWSRTFTDPVTGEKVLVILLVGRPGQMSVHRPEHCYQAAGYELTEAAHQVLVKTASASDELWTGIFTRDEAAGPSGIRIFWTWCAGGRWQAPDNPRLVFARHRAIYKMYVVRTVSGSSALADDPAMKLLRQLLPILDRVLTPS